MADWEIDLSDRLPLVDEPDAIVPTRKVQLSDDIGRRVQNLLRNLTNFQTQFSIVPALPEEAGLLKRLSHQFKLAGYANIAEKETSIASSRRETILQTTDALNDLGMFLAKMQNQMDEIYHAKGMRVVEYTKGCKEIEKLEAEIRLINGKAAMVEAQADRERAEAERERAETSQLYKSEGGSRYVNEED